MEHPTTTRTTMIAGATVLVGFYLIVAFVALFCVAAHAGNHGHVAHHSPMCSWACQANSSVGIITLMNPLLPLLLFISLLDFSHKEYPTQKRTQLSSRSPPR